MSNLKNAVSRKYVLFYLGWTVVFTIIPIAVSRPEKLTLGLIFVAFIISAILSVPATYYFFKELNRRTAKNNNVRFDLLPEEKLILRTNANLKRNMVLLGGVLFLTDKHILFIGTDFFYRNKKLLFLSLDEVAEYDNIDDKRLIITENSGKKNTLILDGVSGFLSELSKILK